MKIHKGDAVIIIAGKDRGKKGKILESFPKDGKVSVEGANLKKKHVKPKRAREKGQIVTISAPFNVSNVKLLCKKCHKATRVGNIVEAGKRYRVCKKCGQRT